ncbi:MAG: helix-turn-helix transcriptional regulator [Clostridiales bacterium]|nr:helix-turn-helix transcriptional regulator [Clostridiales bacterium]
MKEILHSDLSIFDDQLFFYFRNKYRPEIINYLKTKHFFEVENKLDFEVKKHNTFMWNGILIREIVQLGYTFEHLANQYDAIYNKINKCRTLKELQDIELYMFKRYVDIIIHQQEMTDHLLVNKILHYLHLHIENYYTLEELTQELNLSQSYASKIFKEHMKTSIMKYGKELKIKRAQSLLRKSDSITEIGEKLGFYDQAHFSRTFKSFTGTSPQKYRTTIDKK